MSENNAKVYKQTLKNGKIQYVYDGVVKRNSKRDYKYALMAVSKGEHSSGHPFLVGLGNNPQTMRNSWSSIYAHWCNLFAVEITQL